MIQHKAVENSPFISGKTEGRSTRPFIAEKIESAARYFPDRVALQICRGAMLGAATTPGNALLVRAAEDSFTVFMHSAIFYRILAIEVPLELAGVYRALRHLYWTCYGQSWSDITTGLRP